MKLGFIGMGNMAKAIIKGLAQTDALKHTEIYVHSGHLENYATFAKQYGLKICQSNLDVAKQADFLFLAIKPLVLKEVLLELKETLQVNKPVIISMVTGVSLAEISQTLEDEHLPLLRIMPNVNVEINEAMTAVAFNQALSQVDYQTCVTLLEKLGQVIELPEKDFSTFVALAGSSPAYVYFYIDAMARAGVKYGLSKQQATKISAQAVLGSAKKVLLSDKTPMELVDDVCSPGGTTIAGLLAMEEAGLMTAVVKGIDATIARDRTINLK